MASAALRRSHGKQVTKAQAVTSERQGQAGIHESGSITGFSLVQRARMIYDSKRTARLKKIARFSFHQFGADRMLTVTKVADIEPRKISCSHSRRGITLDRGYFIARDRIDTPAKLLEWLAHLLDKVWFTTEQARDLIQYAGEFNSVKVYGAEIAPPIPKTAIEFYRWAVSNAAEDRKFTKAELGRLLDSMNDLDKNADDIYADIAALRRKTRKRDA